MSSHLDANKGVLCWSVSVRQKLLCTKQTSSRTIEEVLSNVQTKEEGHGPR